ncbi:hypothetical protein ACOI22_16775 [Glaciecola sp. 2405UD65-10]|jgi:hypothetical protein|uniref:hypothetical protein n=1 Tax=Glaciecola sp. 2405UD65-10 TaxID=3397244 RepID=UPI003B5A8915
MKLNQTIAALFLVSACAISTQANAQESALEQIVTSYVKSALNEVSNDIDIQIEKSLLTASNMVSFDPEPVPANKVNIVDLVLVDIESEDDEEKSESDANENEVSDD